VNRHCLQTWCSPAVAAVLSNGIRDDEAIFNSFYRRGLGERTRMFNESADQLHILGKKMNSAKILKLRCYFLIVFIHTTVSSNLI
jgi:hypothetical protein